LLVKEDSNADEYLENLQGKTLLSWTKCKCKEGDAFFLETGTVHAIGFIGCRNSANF
jgi:mannose-6-phosphate isomerase class I